jgi:hypothetical protein
MLVIPLIISLLKIGGDNMTGWRVAVATDESDVSTAKTKDDAIISKGSSQITTESSEYSDNSPAKNEKTMNENEEIADHTPSDGGIQATHPTHPTQIQQLQHQQTEMAVAIEPNNAAWPSTNNTNDKNQTAAIIVDVNKTIYRLGHSDTFACYGSINHF